MSAKGVVAAGHSMTAEAGAQMLREGGNAFDAAICAVLTSFATESPLTGLGAGGFMLAHTAAGEEHLLDFFVEAGGRGLDPSGRAELVAAEVVFDETPQVFNIGPASCGVPGTAAGLWQATQRFASMPFAELAAPAIRLAREGVPVNEMTQYLFTILEPIVTYYPETRALYAPEGRLLQAGDVFRFPELADALERLAAEGPAPIYDSDLTRMLCEWVDERGGFLSPEDFRSYEVIERAPACVGYRDRAVLTNAPPSSGGVLIAFALELLRRSDAPPSKDADGLALVAEVMEECNLVRGAEFERGLHQDAFAREFLDSDHVDEALRRLRERLTEHRASSRAPGDRLGSTTHIAAADDLGNAVSITCSNGSCSGVMPPGSAIHLNNMLGEEDLNPLGFHRLEPGTRVTSMMAPTVVLFEGEFELALGSAGSNRLRSAILQVIRNVIDYGMSIGEAVDRGRMHYEGGTLHFEPGFDSAALSTLEQRGYDVVRWSRPNLFFGGAQAVHRDRETGELSGAGDPRRGGASVVVR